MQNRIVKALNTVLMQNKISAFVSEERVLEGRGDDELELIEILLALEEEFEFELNLDDEKRMTANPTMQNLLDVVEAKLSKS